MGFGTGYGLTDGLFGGAWKVAAERWYFVLIDLLTRQGNKQG